MDKTELRVTLLEEKPPEANQKVATLEGISECQTVRVTDMTATLVTTTKSAMKTIDRVNRKMATPIATEVDGKPIEQRGRQILITSPQLPSQPQHSKATIMATMEMTRTTTNAAAANDNLVVPTKTSPCQTLPGQMMDEG